MFFSLSSFSTRVLLLLALCLAAVGALQAQPYGNEWVRYDNVYFKFKIFKDGIYRISKAQLNDLNMGSVSGQQLAIFRDGEEVPLYVSTNGVLGNNDYLEFYATKANGKVDQALYADPAFQANPDLNLFSDTAYYFLTFDNQIHQRLQATANNIPSPTPVPAPFCWVTSFPTKNPRTAFSRGYSYDNRLLYYSSDYDIGEGYAYNSRTTKTNSLIHPTPQKYTGTGAGATLSLAFAGHALNPNPNSNAPAQHSNSTTIGGVTVFDTTYLGFQMIKRSVPLSMDRVGSTNTTVVNADNFNYHLLQMSIRYSRLFNFSGNFAQQAKFQLPANQRYLAITGFNTATGTPRLIDVTQKKIYNGVLQGSTLQFYLDASGQMRDLYLSDAASIETINQFTPVTFRNYSLADHQGDYIILSNDNLISASPNYISQYSAYRSSSLGGGYAPVIVDVAELYDQFAFGNPYHPLAIRNFVHYSKNTWTIEPEYMFIIGKGISPDLYRSYLSTSGQYSYQPIPTFGYPGADNLFGASGSGQVPVIPIGRLSAWNNTEVGNYLTKVKDYEQAMKSPAVPTVASELWKKSALHIAGGNDMNLQEHLKAVLANCATIFSDSLIGGYVHSIAKSSTNPVDDVDNAAIDTLVNKGLAYMTYYGHGSSAGFDYNLNSPANYNSKPRFPVFSTFACEVADIFNLTNIPTISEEYIKAENGGAIVMISGNNTGWTNILQQYMPALYRSWGYINYGKTLGEQYQKNIESLYNPGNKSMSIHLQAMLYQGDPALKLFNPDRPDYIVEAEQMTTTPANISTATDSFTLKAIVYNMGRATHDSVSLTLAQFRPGNTTAVYADTLNLPKLLFADTLVFRVPIDAQHHIGMNTFTLKIDGTDRYDEISEQNNQASIQVFIYSDNLVPIYPFEFSIVHEQGVELKASTLNAFAPAMQYKMEIDTTELFNSDSKLSTTIISSGGLLKWTPDILLKDSTVYYWRTTADSIINGSYNWSNSSFIYLANGSDGWNQSHFYQYNKNQLSALQLPATTRKFKFSPKVNTYKIENKVIYPPTNDYHNVRHSLNDEILDNWGCIYTGSIHIAVFDSVSGMPWSNTNGFGGSALPCSSVNPYKFIYEFATNTLTARNNAKNFIESIPSGNFVMIKNMIYGGPPGAVWDGTTATDWAADQEVNGAGNSLYHAIKSLGFTQIDNFDSKKVFAFFMKKGDPSTILQQVSSDSVSKIELYTTMVSYPDTGLMASTEIGPAAAWKTLKWQASATDQFGVNDSAYVEVIGIRPDQSQQLLYAGFSRDTSLTFISASSYPKLQLNWYSVDNLTRSSAHLDYWRVLYDPLPEAALNAQAKLIFNDSLGAGEEGQLQIAIENLSHLPMDSMLVRFKLIDANNQQHLLADKRYKPLPANDTLIADFSFDPIAYPGKNFLFVEANPDNDQAEHYHPNNLGYLPFYVESDLLNPLLDVTFDGIHILDKDIVSAKPFIKIQMRDENSFLLLNDTALMQLELVYPDQTSPQAIPFDGTICKFIPASGTGGNNQAVIEFKPNLTEDGQYKLIVKGKDKVGNVAGNAPQYEVNFLIENKPSITHVLNYPNPFSTATQFIFTLTGSEIPSQFKIQILSVTGKVVREITKEELGPLHIGRNITEYRWDGRDQYGQLLGNGVYLYRVLTSIRGIDVEHRANQSVDKFFKNGYGKLYIMR